MSVKTKRVPRSIRRRRQAPGVTDQAHVATRSTRRRELGATQDQALYTCQCGFVFQAPVSTSVGCPHCGDTQAW